MAPVPSVGWDASSVPPNAGNHGRPYQTKGKDFDSFNEFCGLRRYFYHMVHVLCQYASPQTASSCSYPFLIDKIIVYSRYSYT